MNVEDRYWVSRHKWLQSLRGLEEAADDLEYGFHAVPVVCAGGSGGIWVSFLVVGVMVRCVDTILLGALPLLAGICIVLVFQFWARCFVRSARIEVRNSLEEDARRVAEVIALTYRASEG